ncbi:hypothetical protein GLAREA_03499 [Glarea lozoyensis ATCC 20868]|uniref:Uncharacterized protein n=1 Tax=Glarea lozoyensis (strain ATCC 20868 / MF5171) TaxID=1116229 RepID=S3CVU2_GLAL2|nr:uncharacterized protein GLAREA_03499 [Glarea lozoyensis ATCC 20868]EPE30532.1 hypothetical protein GLAREA_03499 [Glarea lozoyensis ATCC 20868]
MGDGPGFFGAYVFFGLEELKWETIDTKEIIWLKGILSVANINTSNNVSLPQILNQKRIYPTERRTNTRITDTEFRTTIPKLTNNTTNNSIQITQFIMGFSIFSSGFPSAIAGVGGENYGVGEYAGEIAVGEGGD